MCSRMFLICLNMPVASAISRSVTYLQSPTDQPVSEWIISLQPGVLCELLHADSYLYRCWPAYKRSQATVLSSSQTGPTGWVPPCGAPPLSPCDTGNISGQTPSSLYWCPPWTAAARAGSEGDGCALQPVVGYKSAVTQEVSGKTPVRQKGSLDTMYTLSDPQTSGLLLKSWGHKRGVVM